MSKYQAIIFDLDGTAIENARHAQPSERLIRTIAAHREHIHLIAATGRPFSIAMPVIAALGLTDPCIIFGGTVVIDPTTRAIAHRTTLTAAAVTAILNIAQSYPYQILIRDEGLGESITISRAHMNEEIEMIFLEEVIEPDLTLLKQQISALPDVVATSAPSWTGRGEIIMITHQDATKEHAVAHVLADLGIDRTHTIGVGDGDNDTHLFAAVGHKIAMGNASPTLKAAADEMAPTVDQDGLAKIIERYGQLTTPAA